MPLPPPAIGQRLSYDAALCTVRYVGKVEGTTGQWLGVEWDNASRGKHDGRHKGVRYFSCRSSAPTAASFVRATRPFYPARSFVAALHDKYASEVAGGASGSQIVISGKVAEEVGFDKIRRRLAQLADLKIVILDGMHIEEPVAEGEKSICETCPKVVELDLSRNLFASFAVVVGICQELEALRSLRINGNRFESVQTDEILSTRGPAVFRNVKELSLDECLLTWEDICVIATKFESLTSLSAGTNQLAALPPVPFANLSSTLTSLNLEFNAFTTLSDITPLTALQNLRNLHLKGCQVRNIADPSIPTERPIFSSSLHYVDLSYNQVNSWDFVDDLPVVFPGLIALRFAHNPIYDNPDAQNTTAGGDGTAAAQASAASDEAHMITIGRLAGLKTLNFVTVSEADRANAEMFYLSRIAKQLATVPESAEHLIIAQHRRYVELCALYGEPDVIRRQELDPNHLEARLITVRFHMDPKSRSDAESQQKTKKGGAKRLAKTADIPKSFDIYAVKGIAARLFGLSPLQLGLIWETGEWDPVAGFDDEVGDSSSEEEEAEMEAERTGQEAGKGASERRAGKWVKREVELRDGPRQLGFCVDGLEAKIRVEARG